MFAVGDKVVHPAHGAGVVTDIEQLDVLDEFSHYYVISLIASDMRLLVPVKNAEQVGLRPAIKARRLSKVLAILKGFPNSLPEDYKERQAEVTERLRSADPQNVGTVVRDLTWLRQMKGLTARDTDLLDRAHALLASEVALVKGIALEEAERELQVTLSRSLADLAPQTG